jgi:phosphoglycolate phosphatase
MKNKGVIFDLDGTLWDSTVPVAAAWTQVGKRELGRDFVLTPSDMKAVMGLPMTEIAAKFFPTLSGEERIRVSSLCMAAENRYLLDHPGTPYPGLGDALTKLREAYFLAIVSNCQQGYIEAFLDSLHLRPYFDDFVCWGDDGLLKGGNIALILARNHLTKAFYIGDTHGDETETRLAKIPFVHAAYGFGTALAPDASVGSLSELVGVAKRILG